jgi:hypothetical protein
MIAIERMAELHFLVIAENYKRRGKNGLERLGGDEIHHEDTLIYHQDRKNTKNARQLLCALSFLSVLRALVVTAAALLLCSSVSLW